MDPITAAAIISGGAAIFGGAADNISSGRMNRKQRKWAREQQDHAYYLNLEQWNRENEYNHPANQMKRLEEAGLNPHLVYSEGGATMPAASSPKMTPVEGRFEPFKLRLPDMVALYQDIKLKAQEVSNAQKQGNLIDEGTDKLRIQNLRDVYDMIYNFGNQFYGTIPDKYADDIRGTKGNMQSEKPFKGLKDYQLDAAELKNKSLNTLNQLATVNKEIRDLLKKWEIKRQEEFERTGVNIDKDDYFDRELAKIFAGGEGKLTTTGLKGFLSILQTLKK